VEDVPPGLEAAASSEHFDRLIGLEYGEVGPDRVTGTLAVGPHLHQPNGIVHGGVYASAVESLASVGAAVWAYQNLDGRIAVGLANATDFLRAHREGGLTGEALPVHRGRSQQIWQVTLVRESDGKAVARGQVRLQNIALGDLGS
jgi:1,4-dihydroxy-2-naphthoyl-CoA hydrolase